ncbi:hypothetical protein ACSMX9_13400 [Streptomyces sp. LE64]|uniref:hypothetical protein n=1 Tax=Streptomyces sp. LE64 TaxID=3448653 RepID=UPI0040435F11
MTEEPSTPVPGDLDELRTALDTLARPPVELPWPSAQQLVHRVAPLAWEQLKAHDAWHRLIPTDRAAMYWTLAAAHRIAAGPAPDLAERQPVLAELVRDCAHFGRHCEPRRTDRWPEAEGRHEQREAALHQLAWLQDLHPVWRAEVFRILEHGPGSAPGPTNWAEPSRVWDALGEAQRLIGPGREDIDTTPSGEKDDGSETARRFAELPEGWQAEALRRIGQGAVPRQTVTEANEAIDLLPGFGITLRPAPPP